MKDTIIGFYEGWDLCDLSMVLLNLPFWEICNLSMSATEFCDVTSLLLWRRIICFGSVAELIWHNGCYMNIVLFFPIFSITISIGSVLNLLWITDVSVIIWWCVLSCFCHNYVKWWLKMFHGWWCCDDIAAINEWCDLLDM